MKTVAYLQTLVVFVLETYSSEVKEVQREAERIVLAADTQPVKPELEIYQENMVL